MTHCRFCLKHTCKHFTSWVDNITNEVWVVLHGNPGNHCFSISLFHSQNQYMCTTFVTCSWI
jgi:hypothetical protein